MKKLCLIVALICVFGAVPFAGGCAGQNTDTYAVTEETFYDFEEYYRNFHLIKLLNTFGAVSENRDKTYVSQGERSAKLQPLGNPADTVKPRILFPAYATGHDFNFMDVTKYRSLVGSFYNAEEENVSVEIGFTTSLFVSEQWSDYVSVTPAEKYVLKPGWNEITYLIPHDFLAIFYDLTQMHGVYFQFENAGSYNRDDAPVIYVDNLRFQRLSEPYVPENAIRQTADEAAGVWEIASFEEEAQRYAIRVERADNYQEVVPDLEIIDPHMGDEVGKVLRYYTRPGTSEKYGWPWTYLSPKLFSGIDFSQFEDTAEYEYYFKLDFYNNYKETAGMAVEFVSADHSLSYQTYSLLSAEPQSWTTFSIRLSSLQRTVTDEDGTTRTVRFIDEPGTIYFVYDAYAEETLDRKEFYIDNIRIERVATGQSA